MSSLHLDVNHFANLVFIVDPIAHDERTIDENGYRTEQILRRFLAGEGKRETDYTQTGYQRPDMHAQNVFEDEYD